MQRAPFALLRVPVPDLETQHSIAGIGAAMAQERLTLDHLAATTARLHDITNERIARDLFARAEISHAE